MGIDWRSILAGVITAVILGAGGLAINAATSGQLLRWLGGVTQKDVADTLDVQISLGDTGVGSTSADGSGTYSAIVTQNNCPPGSILISAYCSDTPESHAKGAMGNLYLVGMANGAAYCNWSGITKPTVFQATAKAVCLKIASK
jgi:hypothetical protein